MFKEKVLVRYRVIAAGPSHGMPVRTAPEDAIDYAKRPVELPPDSFTCIGVKKMTSGLYHQVYKLKAGASHKVTDEFVYQGKGPYFVHVISNVSTPFKGGVALLEGSGKDRFDIWGAKVGLEHKGKGYGKLAYLAAISFHQEMHSSFQVSEWAEKVWKGIEKATSGAVTVTEGVGENPNVARVSDSKALEKLLYAEDEKKAKSA